MIQGAGPYQYRVVEGWGLGPDGYAPGGMIAGVATDSQDRLYAFRRTPQASVLVYDRTGRFLDAWGEGVFAEPHAIWIDGRDIVYCTDREDHTVRAFTTDGRLLTTLGSPHQPGAPGMPLNKPAKAVVSPRGEIWVADGYGQCRIHRFSPEGELRLSFGEPGQGPGQFNLPHSLVVDRRGRVMVVDRENHRLQLFDLEGHWLETWEDLRQPMDVCVDGEDTIYVAEAYQSVSIYDVEGTRLARWGQEGTAPGQFASFLHGICADSRGDLYIADERRMQKFERLKALAKPVASGDDRRL
jgi:sugar lactone lactonase YvrE